MKATLLLMRANAIVDTVLLLLAGYSHCWIYLVVAGKAVAEVNNRNKSKAGRHTGLQARSRGDAETM
jgi:hypothetical protein